METTIEQRQAFIEYLRSFYFNEDACYPMKVPSTMEGTESRDLESDLTQVAMLLSMDINFEGDSFDREKARDVLIGLGYGIKWRNDDKKYTYREI